MWYVLTILLVSGVTIVSMQPSKEACEAPAEQARANRGGAGGAVSEVRACVDRKRERSIRHDRALPLRRHRSAPCGRSVTLDGPRQALRARRAQGRHAHRIGRSVLQPRSPRDAGISPVTFTAQRKSLFLQRFSPEVFFKRTLSI